MTPEQIARRQTAWTVFRYERQMYDATWALMQLKLNDLFAHNVCNAIVESHSLHLRNLCAFLTEIEAVQENPSEHTFLDYTDLVERFEEIDVAHLRDVWLTPIAGHPGSPAWVLQIMSDCTIHRRNTYDYSSIAIAIHGPLTELMDQIEKVRAWEIRLCQHDMPLHTMACNNCGATAEDVRQSLKTIAHPTEAPHETEASENWSEEADREAEAAE